AAAKLGLKCHVFAQSPDSPAFDVVHRVTNHDYTDTEALDRFAMDVDVITYEFENIPAESATFLSARRPVLPDPKVLATTQDRLFEKRFVASLGIGTARFAAVDSAANLLPALDEIGLPAVLKTRRFGYDGKGQIMLRGSIDPETVWREIGAQPAILEAFVPFTKEISVVAARGLDGTVACFDVTENEHQNHILKVSRAPAAVSDAMAAQAVAIASRIAEAFGYVGVLAVEMFVVEDGPTPRVLVNEIAPRVHNSGHWTMDGASVSQFEQHIRAIAGWPLGTPVRYGAAEMVNLLGSEVEDAARWLATPGASLHLYGKGSVREGRKMGHVNRIVPGR
ncbi:MAG: 5-(carboxyamino)imidazole ribonucleotide synthase, partial [Rhizobiales bacterium]|nr:5-(carboxyamino)imidazole ribonucleotide synthase [Hyphomicrobiales bacterium]